MAGCHAQARLERVLCVRGSTVEQVGPWHPEITEVVRQNSSGFSWAGSASRGVGSKGGQAAWTQRLSGIDVGEMSCRDAHSAAAFANPGFLMMQVIVAGGGFAPRL